jgi:hypothetical protein
MNIKAIESEEAQINYFENKYFSNLNCSYFCYYSFGFTKIA